MNTKRHILIVAVIVLVFALAGCQPAATPEPTAEKPAPTEAVEEPEPTEAVEEPEPTEEVE